VRSPDAVNSSSRAPTWLRHAGRALLAFVFPDSCLACGRPLDEDERHLCQACRQELSPESRLLAGSSADGGAPVRYAVGFEGPAQALVHALKYGGRTSIAAELAALGRPAAASLCLGGIDALVPVPLHGVRRRERGFDQTELITGALTSLTGVPTDTGCLRRTRATGSQTALPREGRLENVRGAFEGRPATCRGRRLLLVDDVVTTGATLASAASALENAGAALVLCMAVVARGPN